MRGLAGLILTCALAASAAVVFAQAAGQPPAPASTTPPDSVPEPRDAMAARALSANLIKNGSFEEGRYWPYGWDPADGLGTFWRDDGGSQGRRYVRLFTTVLEEQWLPWNEKILKVVQEAAKGGAQALPNDPRPAPPAPRLSTPPYYDSVGGLHGIHYRSDFIPCTPGAVYRFRVDARSEGGTPKVFVKGFFDQQRRTDQGLVVLKRNAYKLQFPLDGCGPQWKRFATEFHPAQSKTTFDGKPIQPQWLRVEIYAYWPVGNYDFDNVAIEIIGHEEIVNKPQPETEQPPARKEDDSTDDDEKFPVF
jgi:hypothetical protein